MKPNPRRSPAGPRQDESGALPPDDLILPSPPSASIGIYPKLSARQFAAAVRGHWRIKNQLHWQLDVTFGEDQSRLRKGLADQIFSVLRRAALTLLKNNTTKKVGVKNKRLVACADESYLEDLLIGS